MISTLANHSSAFARRLHAVEIDAEFRDELARPLLRFGCRRYAGRWLGRWARVDRCRVKRGVPGMVVTGMHAGASAGCVHPPR